MISDSNRKKLISILVGVWLVFGCSQPTPTKAPGATFAPTSQPSPAPPTVSATSAPTPTGQSFVLPSGRLLVSVRPASEGKYPGTDVEFFDQYRWVELPGMAVSTHPLLTGEYPMEDWLVTLSPDRLHLAFVRESWSKIKSGVNTFDDTTSSSVLLADPNGTQPTQIGPPFTVGNVNHVMGCGDAPSWSADGRFFAFALSPNWTSDAKEHPLYIYEVASGKLNTVIIHSQQSMGAFALSPDAAQIATSEIDETPEFALNIHLRNADGSNDRVLVNGWIPNNLAWHPDGRRIFFRNDRGNNQPEPGIYSIDVTTGVTTLITTVSLRASCLELSPDGSLLTYFDDLGIMAVSPEGGEPRPLMSKCKRPVSSRPVWSADSQYIALGSFQQIVIMDRAGNCTALDYHEDKMVFWDLIGWLP